MTVTTTIEHGPNEDILAMGVDILEEGLSGMFADCALFTPASATGTRYPRKLPPHERCSSVALSAHDPGGDGKHAHVILRFNVETLAGEQVLPSVAAVIGALEDAGARFNDTP